MTAYDNDPRVKQVASEMYAVVSPDNTSPFLGATETVLVSPNYDIGGWLARDCTLPSLDEAIRSLIGDPH